MTCRLRELTYDCHIKSDLEFKCYTINENGMKQLRREGYIKNVSIAKIPVMVGSNWCHLSK